MKKFSGLPVPLLGNAIPLDYYSHYKKLISLYESTDDMYDHQWILNMMDGDHTPFASMLRSHLFCNQGKPWIQYLEKAANWGVPYAKIMIARHIMNGWPLITGIIGEEVIEQAAHIILKVGTTTNDLNDLFDRGVWNDQVSRELANSIMDLPLGQDTRLAIINVNARTGFDRQIIGKKRYDNLVSALKYADQKFRFNEPAAKYFGDVGIMINKDTEDVEIQVMGTTVSASEYDIGDALLEAKQIEEQAEGGKYVLLDRLFYGMEVPK